MNVKAKSYVPCVSGSDTGGIGGGSSGKSESGSSSSSSSSISSNISGNYGRNDNGKFESVWSSKPNLPSNHNLQSNANNSKSRSTNDNSKSSSTNNNSKSSPNNNNNGSSSSSSSNLSSGLSSRGHTPVNKGLSRDRNDDPVRHLRNIGDNNVYPGNEAKVSKPLKVNQGTKINLEQQRVASWQHFIEALGKVQDEIYDDCFPTSLDIKDLLDRMHDYYRLTGHYPFEFGLQDCPPAFSLYLNHEGFGPEMYEHTTAFIEEFIKRGNLASWMTYRKILSLSTRDHSYTELFINEIGPGGGQILCEAALLGFHDHRFEHAVTTMQRLYRKQTVNHVKQPEHYIHLKSIADVGDHFNSCCDLCSMEYSILRWNRRCMPEFLMCLIRSGRPVEDYELGSGYVEHMFPDFAEALKAKRNAILAKQINYLLDNDALAKINKLIGLRAAMSLDAWRHPKRDVLKFLAFDLNEAPPAWIGQTLVKDTPIAKSYVERLDELPLHVIDDVFKHVPQCLASYGRDLLTEFNKVNVDKLTEDEMRRWFLSLIIDELVDCCEGSQINTKDLERFLKNKKLKITTAQKDQIIAQIKLLLKKVQDKIKTGKPLYDYRIWIEPIKVTGVTVVEKKEAGLGQ